MIRYRPSDRSFSLRRPNGDVLRLLPRRLILEAAPSGTLAGLRRLARDLAGHLGWIAVAQGWSSPQRLGAILAVSPVESYRAWANLLARARWLDGGSRPAWLDALSADPVVARDGTLSAPNLFKRSPDAADLTALAPPVVIVTPAGWAVIRRDPKRALERLAAFARRHPGTEAVEALDAEHLPAPVPLTRLIAAVWALGVAVPPSITDRNEPHQGQVDSSDAKGVGDPDRSAADPAEKDGLTDDARSDATAKAALSCSERTSAHEGSAHRERGHTNHPSDTPTSDKRNSPEVDDLDDLEPSQEEQLTEPGNEPPDADAPGPSVDQQSPF